MIPGDVSGLARRMWRSSSPLAAASRAVLLPVAGAWRLVTAARNRAYDSGLVPSGPPPVPSIGVGNLSVGGTGKTPLAAWIAGELKRRGPRVGIVLRGYGGDEVAEHRAANPDAVVEAGADRRAAAARAIVRGAQALVFDDCLQHRALTTDVMLALVSADTWSATRWPLPAGPWREGLGALARADAVVVTRKVASRESAAELAFRLAPLTRGRSGIAVALAPGELRGAAAGRPVPFGTLSGREVLVVAGVGEPELVAEQVRSFGAEVRLLDLGDHHVYSASEAAGIAASVPRGGVAVTTAKDAVKLGPLWPAGEAELLVAGLRVQIETGAEVLDALLDRVATAARTNRTPGAAAALPARKS
ncbi:MAG: tetraacyldisaccharide 4'-kinase [Gemmatimonadales bacterium]